MLASVSSSYTDAATTVFSSVIAAKAWFTTFAIVFALVQVLTGARIFGHLERFVPIGRPRVNRVHRWSGRLAILCTLPVAFQCITVLGFRHTDTRVLVHSIAGCFFFGAFAAKVVVVEWKSLPRLALPIAGGVLFSAFVVVWYTGALWFFNQFGFPSF